MLANKEAEAVAIGAALLDNENIPLLLETGAEAFTGFNRTIIEAIATMWEKQQTGIDPVTLSDRLLLPVYSIQINQAFPNGTQEMYAYVDQLTEGVPRTTNLVYYRNIIRELQQYRNLIDLAGSIAKRARNREAAPLELVEALFDECRSVVDCGRNHGSINAPDAAIERISDDEEPVFYYRMPWDEMNKLTGGGMTGGQVLMISGWTGLGKSIVAKDIAAVWGMQGITPFFYTLEMTYGEKTDRLLGGIMQLPCWKFKKKRLTTKEKAFVRKITKSPRFPAIQWADCFHHWEDIAAHYRMKSREHQRHAMIVDYAQICDARKSFSDERTRLDFINRSAKNLAKSLDCPVVIVLQPLRPENKAKPRKLNQFDSKGSSSFENTADIFLTLWRDDYNPNDDELEESDEVELEMRIVKHRGNPRGSWKTQFTKSFASTEYTDPQVLEWIKEMWEFGRGVRV